jgi:enamine deaminase RidA (YjgF/YER057c/UK114 family)
MKVNIAIISLLLLSIISFQAVGQKKTSAIKKLKYNSNKNFEDSIGYTEAVKVGNTIYISGAVGWGKMDEAIKIVYDQLGKILQNYNATFENVVKENLYALDLDSVKKYMEIRRAYYKNDFPAATWVEVKRLFNPDLVLEVELIAILPDDK